MINLVKSSSKCCETNKEGPNDKGIFYCTKCKNTWREDKQETLETVEEEPITEDEVLNQE